MPVVLRQGLMASTTLISTDFGLGAVIAQTREWRDADHIHLDPIEYVSTAQLIAIARGLTYRQVHESIATLTPEQPDVEDWDVDNLFAYVCHIPNEHRDALAGIPDDYVLGIAKQWSKIEELARMPFTTDDLAAMIKNVRQLAAAAKGSEFSLLLFMVP